jgi:hypothetical protein
MSRLSRRVQLQARPQGLGRGIDQRGRTHAFVVGPGVGRADLDVGVGGPLAAGGRCAIRRGGVLQMRAHRAQVLLLHVERKIATQGVVHVTGPEVQRVEFRLCLLRTACSLFSILPDRPARIRAEGSGTPHRGIIALITGGALLQAEPSARLDSRGRRLRLPGRGVPSHHQSGVIFAIRTAAVMNASRMRHCGHLACAARNGPKDWPNARAIRRDGRRGWPNILVDLGREFCKSDMRQASGAAGTQTRRASPTDPRDGLRTLVPSAGRSPFGRRLQTLARTVLSPYHTAFQACYIWGGENVG